jgi:hypothetical protein
VRRALEGRGERLYEGFVVGLGGFLVDGAND